MAILSDLPPELILHIVSFLTRLTFVDEKRRLPEHRKLAIRILKPHLKLKRELIPDLSSINALSRTNTYLYRTLDRALYDLCASIEPLGRLALLFAVEHEMETAVERLVAAGISLDAEYCFRDDNCGLLNIAAALDLRTMVVKLLEMYGAEMTTSAHRRLGILSDGRTALDYAAQFGRMEIVRLLAPIPPPTISPSAFSHRDYLSFALVVAVQAQNTRIAGYLISEGADVNFMTNKTAVPLYYAVFLKNLTLVKLLLASGADPNAGCGDAVLIAARGQNLDIIQALVDGGADIHDHGLNVLSHCTSSNTLRFFLERGVDPNTGDGEGRTVLHRFCMTAKGKELVEVLCEFGAMVDKTDHYGQTAVDFAMHKRFAEILNILEPYVQDPGILVKIVNWREARGRLHLQRYKHTHSSRPSYYW